MFTFRNIIVVFAEIPQKWQLYFRKSKMNNEIETKCINFVIRLSKIN